MPNMDKLIGKIAEKRTNQKKCAKVLEISDTAFRNKIYSRSEFTVKEMRNLSDYLELSLEERVDIFLR